MPSTYSPNLRIELIASGEQANTWGNITNRNLGTLIEEAISGSVAIDVTAGDVTLTALDGVSDQSRNMILLVSGTAGVSRTLTAPDVSKVYVVRNDSDSDIEITATAGLSVTIPVATSKLVYCDGTDFYFADDAMIATASRAVVSDSDGVLTASATTSTELGYVSGVTSAIQTQLNAKAPSTSGTSILYGNGSGGFSNVSVGANLQFSGGVLSAPSLGTVSSVAMTVPTGLSISGSPITTSGTLNITTALSGVLKGTGSGFSAATAGTDYVAPGGALGTPSSGTLTSCAGLPLSTGVVGTLPVANGGTGITSAGTAGNLLQSTGTGWQSATIPSGFSSMAIITSSTTWTIPAGVYNIKVTVVGGGGGGGGQSGGGGTGGTSQIASGTQSISTIAASGGGGGSTTYVNLAGSGSGGDLNFYGNGGGSPGTDSGGNGGGSYFGGGAPSYYSGLAGSNYGGGGCGGGIYPGPTGHCSGGSGGGAAIKYIAGVTPGNTLSVTVGAGGAGGTASSDPGGAGGKGVVVIEY